MSKLIDVFGFWSNMSTKGMSSLIKQDNLHSLQQDDKLDDILYLLEKKKKFNEINKYEQLKRPQMLGWLPNWFQFKWLLHVKVFCAEWLFFPVL